MKRLFSVLLVLALAAGLAVAVSMPACGGGGNGEECAAGEKKCPDGKCHACCVAADCAPSGGCDQSGMVCNASYACECTCLAAAEDCSTEPGSCCTGLVCDVFSKTCVEECESAADCAGIDVEFASDLQCTDGVCDFQHCSRDGNCRAGTVCYNGDCVTPADCSQIASCKVVPASAVTQEGTTAGFAATAFLTSGALAPGASFSWASSDSAVAAVSAQGVVTGGANTGTATITATVSGCSTDCDASVVNYGAVASGHTRVVVIDELAGTPVQGANVVVGTEAAVTTDATGVADVAVETTAGSPHDILVTKADYNYVLVKGVTNNDLIVHAGKLFPSDQAGGFRGQFNFDMVTCLPDHPCEVKLGLAGPSIPGNLVNLNFEMLLGDMIKTHIELGGSNTDVGLPGGLVLGLNQTWFKQFFSPTGVPGTRVAWGLGGKMDLSTLISKLGPIISGGEDIDIGSLLASLLPLFKDFYTSLTPNVEVALMDKVVDVNDINDNGETTDLVADFDHFPQLPGGGMTLKVAMDQKLTFTPPTLPLGVYDGIVVLAGVIVKDAGLVPLGLSAGMDSLNKDDVPDGIIDDPIELFVSEVAGRIPEDQVQRVVVILGLNVAALAGGVTGEEEIPMTLAGQVMFVDDFTGSMTIPAFMAPPSSVFDPATRELTFTDFPATADYMQAIFAGDNDANWHFLADKAVTSITLPAAPAEGDRAESANFVAIDLADGATFQDLTRFGSGKNLGNLVQLVKAFVFTESAEPAP